MQKKLSGLLESHYKRKAESMGRTDDTPKDSEMTERLTLSISLYPFSVLSLGATLMILVTAIAIHEGQPWVTAPGPGTDVYTNPAYRKVITFSTHEYAYSAFRYVVAKSDEPIAEVPVVCGTPGDTIDQCSGVVLISNHTQAKTLSMSLIQHPGYTLITYGIAGSILSISAALLSVCIAYRRLALLALIGECTLMFVLARTETHDSIHALCSILLFFTIINYHNSLANRVSGWYKFTRTYQSVIWFSGLNFSIMLLTSAWEYRTHSYARYELACLTCIFVMQLFASHIMIFVSPTVLICRLPRALGTRTLAFDGLDSPKTAPDLEDIPVKEDPPAPKEPTHKTPPKPPSRSNSATGKAVAAERRNSSRSVEEGVEETMQEALGLV